jgi:hypothetical protein
MSSSFPNALDALPTNHQDDVNEVIHAVTTNKLADAVNKIESELGVNPSDWATTVAARFAGLEQPTLSDKSTTFYTLADGDQNGVIVNASSTSTISVTVPQNVFSIGEQIIVRQGGAGQVTFVAGVGVTLHSRGGAMKIAGQYGYATLICVGLNTFDLIGDLTS